MCYTTEGPELTRITVISSDNQIVYETLVKPDNPIVDYNTRFSGIVENDLISIKTTIRDVQAALLTIFSDKTILIGHSLENDLQALKVFRFIGKFEFNHSLFMKWFICYFSWFTARWSIRVLSSRTIEDLLTRKPCDHWPMTSWKKLFRIVVMKHPFNHVVECSFHFNWFQPMDTTVQRTLSHAWNW